ncbi:GGDEF domain-containing protein [Vibrio hannami]|uniref:GGDEF domain-containing protein n=1 Tax=Vibrio hannami TaxID=2717094 RepID=UPI003EBD03BD
MQFLSEQIQREKNRIADGVLFFYGLFVILPVIASVARALDIGWKPAMLVHITMVIVAWSLYFFKSKLSYTFRAYAIVGIFTITGFSGIFQFGVVGNGMTWTILSPVIATLLLGVRVGISLVLACCSIIIGTAIFVVQGQHAPQFDVYKYAISPRSWADFTLSFFFIATVLSVATGKLNEGLIIALKVATVRNKEIEEIVKKRTNELNIAYKELELTNTQINDKNRELEEIASKDPLTHLYNRRAFTVFAEKEMSRAARHNSETSVILIDIDHFKEVNDKHGHDVGDTVLSRVAHILSHYSRKENVICRWGGEEFIVLIAEASSDMAFHAAESLRKQIVNEAFEPLDGLTISAGVAAYQVGEPLKDWVHRADIALYAAKSAGRNCTKISE